LTGDDQVQSSVARAIMAEAFILPTSVFLETEWVLRSWYRWTRPMIVHGLRLLIDLPALHDLPPNAIWALNRYEAGADFADVVHIASTTHATIFATFDGSIAGDAGQDSPIPVETLI
jgi:predicted nucleic-acid-binding protein